MGLGKSKQSTGRSGYHDNFSSSPPYRASHYSHKQGYGSHNRNHGAAAVVQLGTKRQNQQQHLKQQQQNQQYQQQRQQQAYQQQQDTYKQHQQYQQQQPRQTLHTYQQNQQVLKERNKNTEECFVCGHEGHSGLRCYHRKMTCYICNQTGHIRSVCKQKQHHPESIYKPKPKPKPNQPNKTTQRTTKPKP